MSFKREGDDFSAINIVKKRRVEELLSEDIPDDEANLTKNGRFACFVCPNRPVLDTIEMLCLHRGGKRHKSFDEQFFRKKREFHQLVEKRRQDANFHGNKDNEIPVEAPLLLQARKASQNALLRYAPYNPISTGAQSGQNTSQDFSTKRSKKKGFFEYTRNFLTNNVPLRKSTEGALDAVQQSSVIHRDRNSEPISITTEDGGGSSSHGGESDSKNAFILKPYVSKRKKSNEQDRENTKRTERDSRGRSDEDGVAWKDSDRVSSSQSQSETRRREVEKKSEDDTDDEKHLNDKERQHSSERHNRQSILEYPPLTESGIRETDRRLANIETDRRNMSRSEEEGLGCEMSMNVRREDRKQDREILRKDNLCSISNDKSDMKSTIDVTASCREGGVGGHKQETKEDIKEVRKRTHQLLQRENLSDINKRDTKPDSESPSHQMDELHQSRQNRLTSKPMGYGSSVKFSFTNFTLGSSSSRQKSTGGCADGKVIIDEGRKTDDTEMKKVKKKKKEKSSVLLSTKTSKYSEDRKRELKQHLELTSSGWVHDPSGKWIRDENVEFDSDEDEEAITE